MKRMACVGLVWWSAVASSCLGTVRGQSGIPWEEDWPRAVAKAKVSARSILLLVTAPQWDRASKQFEDEVMSDTVVRVRMRRDYVCYRIELRLKEAKGKADSLAPDDRRVVAALRLHGYQGLPRVVLLDPNERIYGRSGPMGKPVAFLDSLDRWEVAREITVKPTKDAAKSTSLVADAVAARNLKSLARAEDLAQLAVLENPRSAYAHFVLGLIHADLGKQGESTKCYHCALSLDSTGNPMDGASTIWAAGSWYNLAAASLGTKQWGEALFYLRENQRTDLRTDAPMLRHAERMAADGRPELGYDDFSELLSRNSFASDWLARGLELEDMIWGGKK